VVSHAGSGGLLNDVPIADKAVNAVISCIFHHNARVNSVIVLAKKLTGTKTFDSLKNSACFRAMKFFGPLLGNFF
jgi:hypothetical protein